MVLSRLDSRQPIEAVLDQGIGGIFSARVAGNVLNDDILGSMEFGCKVSGAKLIAVIGHSNCGAIKGAVDDVQLGNLTGLLGKIEPAIDAVPAGVQPRTSKNYQFVDDVSEANVRLVLQQIRERSPSCARRSTRARSAWPPGKCVSSTNSATAECHGQLVQTKR